MTKSPKKTKAKDIEITKDDLRKKRREDFYQKKRYLVVELRAEGWPIRKIAGYIGMSVGFVHKWCLRLAAEITEAMKAARCGRRKYFTHGGEGIREATRSRSTAPKNTRRRITREDEETVVRVRNERFTKRMGAQKLRIYCGLSISHQSIHAIIQKAGLVKPYKKRKQQTFDPFRRGHPNELWQIDYKEFGRGIYMLSVKDDHSSAILAADVRKTCRTEDVIEIVEKAGRMFGYPEQILSDHGTQWYAVRGGTSRFDEWCSEHSIEHIMGRVRKPTTQGKIERWHGSVLEEAELPPKGSTAEEYGKAVLEYMEFYNNRRPHHGIGLQIPMVVYMAGIILPEVFSALGVHEVT
jgi:transposase InsO family protein